MDEQREELLRRIEEVRDEAEGVDLRVAAILYCLTGAMKGGDRALEGLGNANVEFVKRTMGAWKE